MDLFFPAQKLQLQLDCRQCSRTALQFSPPLLHLTQKHTNALPDEGGNMNEIDFKRDREIAKDFLQRFADPNGEAKYMNILQDVANRKTKAIQIELEDLINYRDLDEDFLRRVTENTPPYIRIFADAIDEILPDPMQSYFT